MSRIDRVEVHEFEFDAHTLAREWIAIHEDLKRDIRPFDPMGHGPIDIALWGEEAFVDFARHCRSLGDRAFRVHGWNDGDAREEAGNVLHVAKHVGHETTLMLDPACELRTIADALPPVDARGHSDPLDRVDADGCVDVPTGAGLGVTCDRDFIAKHRTARHVFE